MSEEIDLEDEKDLAEDGKNMEIDDELLSDSDDSSDDKLEQQVKELEVEIVKNVYNYDLHVQIIDAHRKLMNITEMRTAYERFRKCYPLTDQLWLDWIRDEVRIASSDTEKDYVLGLFEKAVEDYLSVDLWLEYVQYSVGCNSADETRKVFEKAITAAGLHVAKGSLIWDAYREFELAHLGCITDADSEVWLEQAKRVAEVFRRQLGVTLLDMERTYIEWRVWCEKLPRNEFINKDQVEWAYKKATKYMDDYKEFEERLLTDEDKWTIYRDYIKYERGIEMRRCLYERAVAESSLDSEIWLDYCRYFFRLNDFPSALKICERALRNCPWSEELWVHNIRFMELSEKPHDEITNCLEKSLESGFQHGYQYLQLWMAYLEHYRRITDASSNDSVEKLRSAFQKGYEYLSTNFGTAADPESTVLRLWARIEANFLKNMQEARKIWNDYGILKNHGTSATFWLELIELEQRCGDEKHLRKTYQRAASAVKDWPQCIAQSWVMFERECGTADSMMDCLDACSHYLKKHEKEIAENVENQEQEQNRKRKHTSEKPYYKTKQGKIIKDVKKPEPPPPPPKPADIEMKDEPKEDDAKKYIKIDKDRETRSIFISNLDYTVTEDELREFLGTLEELHLVSDKKGNSKGYAYATFPTQDHAEKVLARDRERLSGRPVFISKCNMDKVRREKHFVYSTTKEQHKLFVRGLPMTMSEDEVTKIFSPHGKLKDLRLVTYRNGRSKGLAYVEYATAADAARAILATDNTEVRGFTISVAISEPPRRKTEEQPVAEAPRHAKSRLQIPLVPTKVIQASKASTSTLTNEDFRKMLLNDK